MDEEKERIEGNIILKEQFEFYKKYNIKVHIQKTNGQYYNGTILEISSDMVIFDDRKLGAMPIHFIEIKFVEKLKEL